MKILYLSHGDPDTDFSGVPLIAKQYINHFSKIGHECALLLPNIADQKKTKLKAAILKPMNTIWRLNEHRCCEAKRCHCEAKRRGCEPKRHRSEAKRRLSYTLLCL